MASQQFQQTQQKIPAKVLAAVLATGLLSFCGVIIET